MTQTFGSWFGKLALMLASTLVSLEAGSCIYLTFRQPVGMHALDRYIEHDILPQYVRFAEGSTAAVIVPHSRLGWYRAPSRTGEVGRNLYVTDADGAREVPGATGPLLAATYGDSFTEGLEVDNGQTWPARLSYELGITVKNYAVSGYGPDQALLYLEENLKAGKRTPLVFLAFIPENLNRLVNAFRPFYTYPLTDFIAFKPIFVEARPGEFTEQFFAPAESTANAVISAARQASAVDHWFNTAGPQASLDGPRWPFTLKAAHSLRPSTREAALRVRRTTPPAARQVMRHIIRRFHEASTKYAFTPVVVALPGDHNDFKVGITDLDELLADELPGLVYIDVSRATNLPANIDYATLFTGTHYSVLANEEVGRVVAAQIRPIVDALRSSSTPSLTSLTIFDANGSMGLFDSGWYPPEGAGPDRWRWAGGERSTIRIHSMSSAPMTMTLKASAIDWPGQPEQQVEVVINAVNVGTLRVTPEVQPYALEVPGGVLKAGTNVIEFRYRWSVSPQTARGIGDARSLAVAWHELKLSPR